MGDRLLFDLFQMICVAHWSLLVRLVVSRFDEIPFAFGASNTIPDIDRLQPAKGYKLERA